MTTKMRASSQCLSIPIPLDARRRLLQSHENECRTRTRYRQSTLLHLETILPAELPRNRRIGNYCAKTARLPQDRTRQSANRVFLLQNPVPILLTKRKVARPSD